VLMQSVTLVFMFQLIMEVMFSEGTWLGFFTGHGVQTIVAMERFNTFLCCFELCFILLKHGSRSFS
jgi:hypothetical protein